MGVFDSITNIDVEKMIIATGIMSVAALVIFFKRRLNEYKHKVEEEK